MGGVISVGPSSLGERKRKLRQNKKEEERQRKRAQQEEARRKQLLEKYGVLVPPVFLANKTDDPPLSSRVWDRLAKESSSTINAPNGDSDLLSWAYRRSRSKSNSNEDTDAGPLIGKTLLTEYMAPGLFLSLPIAASGANDGGRFIAALTPQPVSEEASAYTLPSFLSLTKNFHRNSFLFFPFPWKVETFMPQNALLSTSSPSVLPSSMRFVADLSSPTNKNRNKVTWTTHFLEQNPEINTPGKTPYSPFLKKVKDSWIETEMVRPDCWNSGISLRVASAMTLDCVMDNVLLETIRAGNDAYLNWNAMESKSNPLGTFLRSQKKGGKTKNDTVRLRLAAEYKESILASSTNLSLTSLLGKEGGITPVVTSMDTLLSLNLNGGGNQEQSAPSQPPLWLTLQQTRGHAHGAPSSFSLNLCQVVTFDREIWNILEDRAPKVRNHVGWVCQIERFANNQSSEDGEASSTSVLSLGASAQFNRNLAAKVILESRLASTPTSMLPSTTPSTPTASTSSQSSIPSAALKFAFVFKRWLEPQASLSVIQKVDLFSGKWSFLGLGLEIEQNKPIASSVRGQPKSTRDGNKSRTEYRDSADIDPSSSVAPPTKVRVELPSAKR